MANVIPVTLPAEAELVPCHYVAEVTDGVFEVTVTATVTTT